MSTTTNHDHSTSKSDLGDADDTMTWQTNSTTSSYIVLQSTTNENINNNNDEITPGVSDSSNRRVETQPEIIVTNDEVIAVQEEEASADTENTCKKLLVYLRDHLFLIVYIIVICSNLAIVAIGFTFIKKCPLNEFLPVYLISFGVVTILRMKILIFFPHEKTRTDQMNFYFDYLLTELETFPVDDENRLQQALLLIEELRKNLEQLDIIQTAVLNFLKRLLESLLIIMFLYTLFIVYEKNSIVKHHLSDGSKYCDLIGYTTVHYHVIAVSVATLALLVASFAYLLWPFVKRVLKRTVLSN